jgi:hypothetical protein
MGSCKLGCSSRTGSGPKGSFSSTGLRGLGCSSRTGSGAGEGSKVSGAEASFDEVLRWDVVLRRSLNRRSFKIGFVQVGLLAPRLTKKYLWYCSVSCVSEGKLEKVEGRLLTVPSWSPVIGDSWWWRALAMCHRQEVHVNSRGSERMKQDLCTVKYSGMLWLLCVGLR